MKVRLTRKFSNLLDGIDLSRYQKGDTLDLPARDADMLVAEGWAEPTEALVRDRAADGPARPRRRGKSQRP